MELTPPQIVRAEVRAYGRVQGVFYRDTLRRAAADRRVAGSAKNLSDGTVEAVFEGEKFVVDEMIEVARDGSSGAVVERLEIAWEEPQGLTHFAIG